MIDLRFKHDLFYNEITRIVHENKKYQEGGENGTLDYRKY